MHGFDDVNDVFRRKQICTTRNIHYRSSLPFYSTLLACLLFSFLFKEGGGKGITDEGIQG